MTDKAEMRKNHGGADLHIGRSGGPLFFGGNEADWRAVDTSNVATAVKQAKVLL